MEFVDRIDEIARLTKAFKKPSFFVLQPNDEKKSYVLFTGRYHQQP